MKGADYGIHVLKRSMQDQNKLEGEYRQQLIRLANHIVETQPSYRHEDISAELINLGDIELLKKLFLGKPTPTPLISILTYLSRWLNGLAGSTLQKRFSCGSPLRMAFSGWTHFCRLANLFPMKVKDS